MITLLSPTRTMNMSPVLGTYPPATTPQFLSEAERIISGVKELSAKELEKQMNLSQEIAENDFHYFQQSEFHYEDPGPNDHGLGYSNRYLLSLWDELQK